MRLLSTLLLNGVRSPSSQLRMCLRAGRLNDKWEQDFAKPNRQASLPASFRRPDTAEVAYRRRVYRSDPMNMAEIALTPKATQMLISWRRLRLSGFDMGPASAQMMARYRMPRAAQSTHDNGAHRIIRSVTRVFPKQGNLFAFYIEKPDTSTLFPWLVNSSEFNRSYVGI